MMCSWYQIGACTFPQGVITNIGLGIILMFTYLLVFMGFLKNLMILKSNDKASFSSPRHGFTMIELSIVIVIIGLILGGVFLGQSLVRQYQLQATVRQVQEFQTAMMTFRVKYNYWPGDIPNATSFFGTNPNCATDLEGGEGVCNGDGDDAIDLGGPSQVPPREQFQAWRHMAHAGLISGQYTGVTNNALTMSGGIVSHPPANGYAACTFANCPPGPLNQRHVYMLATMTLTPTANWWSYHRATGIQFGGVHQTHPERYPGNPIITSSEAYALDLKTDDGKPGLGFWKVFGPSYSNYSSECATMADGSNLTDAGANQDTAVYNVDGSTAKRCSMVVFLD